MVRIKHRYLLLNILYPDNQSTPKDPSTPWPLHFRRPSSGRLDGRLLTRLIRDGVSELFGDYGAGMVAGSLQVKYISPATSTAIVRVARAHYRMVWAALTFATRLPKPLDVACVVQVVRVSGTIRKAEEEAVRRARGVIGRVRRAEKGEEDEGEGEGDGDLSVVDGIEDRDDGGEEDED